MSSLKWNEYHFNLSKVVATKSKDRSTQVGCVIVGKDQEIRTTGFNGFPRGFNDDVDTRHDRPEKYIWTEHAERNAIYNAAKVGVPLHGCTAYVTMFPCPDCARALIQAGIKELHCPKPDLNHPTYGESFKSSMLMFEECGVLVYNDVLFNINKYE